MKTIAEILTREEKCLLVELAFAALSFGMSGQALLIFTVLPSLISDSEALLICKIILLVGLRRYEDAMLHIALLPEKSYIELLPLLQNCIDS